MRKALLQQIARLFNESGATSCTYHVIGGKECYNESWLYEHGTDEYGDLYWREVPEDEIEVHLMLYVTAKPTTEMRKREDEIHYRAV